MDIEKLVAEVIRRIEVIQREAEAKSKTHSANVLLISKLCHQGCQITAASQKLEQDFNVDYAINLNYELGNKKYAAILVYDFDSESATKLISGIFDNPYLKLIAKCLLNGFKITIVEDELEAVKYKNTAPRPMLDMIRKNYRIIKSWGVVFAGELETLNKISQLKPMDENFDKELLEKGVAIFNKKFITEKDVSGAIEDGYKCIAVKQGTVITDIAKEYIIRRNIEVLEK